MDTAALDIYTVSAIANAIKGTIEKSFSNVRVKGEISGLKYADSGHVYFSLKDEGAVLHAICWKGVASRLPFRLEDGLEVICSGAISTYPGRSVYQITASNIEIAGVGALLKMLEQRKKAFAAEGLFDINRKKPLPYLPKVIGVVTSPTGAVIRDILHRIRERYPVHVLVWGVLVQGPEAAGQIASAIAGFHNLPSHIPSPDLLIVARGGGSVEDLWAFNEEEVVRAVAAAKIPIISAVGHETDTTLIDYVADKRAPTPTAAAEIALPVKRELEAKVQQLQERLATALPNLFARYQLQLRKAAVGLQRAQQIVDRLTSHMANVALRLGYSMQRMWSYKNQVYMVVINRIQPHKLEVLLAQRTHALVHTATRLHSRMKSVVDAFAARFVLSGTLLESYHYHKVLARGFAIVRNKTGKVVRAVGQAIAAGAVNIEFADGSCNATIEEGVRVVAPEKKTSRERDKQVDAKQQHLQF
ncbi:MAG: exodeoxyribonuclease VII large subunit [Proteobacteria bacterium]|nr:exodeoxyribonuclease VII large subunit [Pseudomonadota bacterium]